MRIVAAGVSGFIGTRLVKALRGRGDEVVTLVRRAATDPSQVQWDPDSGALDDSVLDGADAVVNLCGVGVGDHRWTDTYKALIITSRVDPTTLLSAACAEKKVPTLVNACAVGYYGHTGDEELSEDANAGTNYLANVCLLWEDATRLAAESGVRVVNLRTGLVLGRGEGLLGQLSLVVKLFAGGRLGSGKQWCPWISVSDEVRAILHLIDGKVSGPVNLTAPHPVINAELVRAIGARLHRPTPWVVPEFALRAVVGEFAGEITTGQRAVPSKLLQSGFAFDHPELAGALAAELS